MKDFNSQMEDLISLAGEIIKVLQKIKNQSDTDQKENAENGRWEFAYIQYYLKEVSSLLNLSVYLLKHDTFRKYTYFPARLIMEIVLQQEHVYSVKNKKGLNGVRRLFFKDIAISAKSSLAAPRRIMEFNTTLLACPNWPLRTHLRPHGPECSISARMGTVPAACSRFWLKSFAADFTGGHPGFPPGFRWKAGPWMRKLHPRNRGLQAHELGPGRPSRKATYHRTAPHWCQP